MHQGISEPETSALGIVGGDSRVRMHFEASSELRDVTSQRLDAVVPVIVLKETVRRHREKPSSLARTVSKLGSQKRRSGVGLLTRQTEFSRQGGN